MASLRAFPRVGIVVPKYGHNSVERNRIKRQLRELIRVDVLPVLPPIDVVLRAAPRAYSRDFAELQADVRKIGRQLTSQFAERRPTVAPQRSASSDAELHEPPTGTVP